MKTQRASPGIRRCRTVERRTPNVIDFFRETGVIIARPFFFRRPPASHRIHPPVYLIAGQVLFTGAEVRLERPGLHLVIRGNLELFSGGVKMADETVNGECRPTVEAAGPGPGTTDPHR